MSTQEIDLLIIGGGINGVGIAADAAGRGLKVSLCEINDLASGTSSYSSKLIHGGLRYLEHCHFGLVRQSLKERERLLRLAPHLVRPMSFYLPLTDARPAWLVRFGLYLYDCLAGQSQLAKSAWIQFAADDPDQPLKPDFRAGLRYSDCTVDDARLVITNALAAKQQGADILTRTDCQSVSRKQGCWHIKLYDKSSNQYRQIQAKALVNATGPWCQHFIEQTLGQSSPYSIRLVQGSHIVVPKLYTANQAFVLQHADQRIAFVIPFQQDYSLIGTTDLEISGSPEQAQVTEQEIVYLLNLVNHYFKKQLTQADICWQFCGVRPLLNDRKSNPAKVTRDYKLAVEDEAGQAPLISVFGGKLTGYRQLAEQVVNRLKPYFSNLGPAWTARHRLPGGDQSSGWQKRYPWLAKALGQRYEANYGSLSQQLLAGCSSSADLGRHFGCGLYQREVDYLLGQEWACSVEDVLWRRTKLGLKLDQRQINSLADYLK
jgi:glycerol-3-phosphate dehydrogenase